MRRPLRARRRGEARRQVATFVGTDTREVVFHLGAHQAFNGSLVGARPASTRCLRSSSPSRGTPRCSEHRPMGARSRSFRTTRRPASSRRVGSRLSAQSLRVRALVHCQWGPNTEVGTLQAGCAEIRPTCAGTPACRLHVRRPRRLLARSTATADLGADLVSLEPPTKSGLPGGGASSSVGGAGSNPSSSGAAGAGATRGLEAYRPWWGFGAAARRWAADGRSLLHLEADRAVVSRRPVVVRHEGRGRRGRRPPATGAAVALTVVPGRARGRSRGRCSSGLDGRRGSALAPPAPRRE